MTDQADRRPVGAARPVLGTDVPRLEPGDLAEARDAVRDTPGALRFAGAGTKAGWGMPVERCDAVVSTRRLDRLVDHSPGDMVAVVEAGMPLADLQTALAEARQWLAVDPPRTDRGATIGGVFTCDDAGPRRLRYGSLRDLVIGVTVILADGSIGRAGGRVVKNVAGYDLMRLLCGSLGTLGLVTSLTVRLHPLSEASATVRMAAAAPRAWDLAVALRDRGPALLSALEWADGALHARLEGREPAVRTAAARVQAIAAAHGTERADLLTGEAEAATWARLAALPAGTTGHAAAGIPAGGPGPGSDGAAAASTAAGTASRSLTVARAAALPDRFPAVVAALAEAADRHGVRAEAVASAGLGLVTAGLTGGEALGQAGAVADWRRTVAGLGGSVVLRDRAPGVEDHVDAWLDPDQPVPSALPLMRRVKAALDPERRCAPGCFVGGI